MAALKCLIIQVVIILGLICICQSHECNFPECVDEAKRLSKSIDQNINACEDFVEFACGKQFRKFSEIRSSDPTKSIQLTNYRLRLWQIRKKLQEELNEPRKTEDIRGIQLAKSFWQSCKITSSDEALAGVRLLFKRLGGWPAITDAWNDSHFNWEKFSKCSRRLGFLPSIFIHVGLNVDEIHHPWSPNDTIKLTIERPVHAIRSVLQNSGYLEIANSLSESKTPDIIEINEALEFGRQLHQLKCSDGKTEDMKRMSIEILQKLFPIVNWIKYIKSLLTRRQANNLSPHYHIFVNTCFLSAVIPLLQNTDKRILANYAFLGIVDDLFRVIRPQLALTFATSSSEVEQICFDSTAAIFGKTLDMIMAKLVEKTPRDLLQEIETNVFNKVHEIFHEASGIDYDFETHIVKNLRSLSVVNLYPVDIFNDKYFDRIPFSLLHIQLELIQPDATLVLFREVNVFLVDHYYLQAGHPRRQYIVENKTALFSLPFSPSEITVRSDLISNKIYIPAGLIFTSILRTIPELVFLNYAVLGLEIAAGLTDHIYQKVQYIDQNGSQLADIWWPKSREQQFMKQQSCNVIGSVKMENYQDILRIIWAPEISYRAAFESCPSKLCSTKLPGLNFTIQQLFWINVVASDCDENLKSRYNSMISQSDNFSNDFNCPSGSKMNPIKKCKVS